MKTFAMLLAVIMLLTCLTACKGDQQNGGEIPLFTENKSPNGVTVNTLNDKALAVVDGAQFGFDPAAKDNTAAFNAALGYCVTHPGSMLVIPKGTYYFDNPSKLTLRGAKNLIIDFQGSTFIFRDDGLFMMNECDTIEYRNLYVDWDWENERNSNLIKIINKAGPYMDMEFLEVDDVDPSKVIFNTMTKFDPETLTPGCEGGYELWPTQLQASKVEKIKPNVLRVYGMSAAHLVEVGDIFLQRNFECRTHVFQTAASHHVTYRNITIYSGPGMGFVFSNGSSHVMVKDCVITRKPGTEDVRHLTTQADAVHCIDTAGHIWIEGCDFSFMGDDGTNIQDCVSVVRSVAGSHKLVAQNTMKCQKGDTIIVHKDNYQPTDIRITVESYADNFDGTVSIIFEEEIPAELGVGWILRNAKYDSGNYYIANNYYHESRARGILAQASNGLITGNRIYRTQGQAIRVVTEVSTGHWSEGFGVDGVTIVDNTIERCNVSNWAAIIDIQANVDGKNANYGAMQNITIENNTFIDFPGYWITVASAKNLVVKGNTIKNSLELKNSTSYRGVIYIEKSSDVTITGNIYVESPYMDKEKCLNPIQGNDVSGVTVTDNTWTK